MIWLNNARVISIFAVLFLHVSAIFVIETPLGVGDWWIGNICDSIARWCVPVFVMISGALLLDPKKEEDLKVFYSKRASKIIVPMLFWSLFFLFFGSLGEMARGESIHVIDLIKKIILGKPYYHLWFLYMIFFLYIFTPFFRKITLNCSQTEICALITITLTIAAINAIAEFMGIVQYKLFINWHLSYISYFFIGYLIRVSNFSYSKLILWFVFFISVAITAFGCYYVAKNHGLTIGLYFYDNLSVTVIPMSISAMLLLKGLIIPAKNIDLIQKITPLTFGIYLIHPIFLSLIIHLWHGYKTINPMIVIPVLFISVSILSLAAAWLISKTPYLKRVI